MLFVSGGFQLASTTDGEKLQKAILAGGCFWCMEPLFEGVPGIEKVLAGYAGGDEHRPNYQKVSSGKTDYREAIEITYNPEKITYEKLLDIYWRNIDPTDAGGQFADRGKHYQTAIFYINDKQKRTAEKSRQALHQSGRFTMPIVVAIIKATTFYPAMAYQQDYYKKNEAHYTSYYYFSGRELFLEKYWPE